MKFAVRILAILVILGVSLLPLQHTFAQSTPSAEEFTWTSVDEAGNPQIHLYFFWSLTCPHCREADPFIEALPQELPWLVLHSLELTQHQDNAFKYVAMAASLGQEAMYVPGFLFCETMIAGYDSAETTGAEIKQQLIDCYAAAQAELATAGPGAVTEAENAAAVAAGNEPGAAAKAQPGVAPAVELTQAADSAGMLSIPLIGQFDASGLSLPMLTVIIAGLDAFNPCAFFVLMFLLSLMVHAQSRRRMLLIGGVFVLFSGLIYFLFMSAWLNVFLWVGELKLITTLAGIVAVIIAAINIKDFFWYKQGVSLTIPESAKPGLYARMRNLVQAGSLGAMLASTVLLAIAANTYELLCTAGFPMVYTRILTMKELPTFTYYLYLALYNLIYIVPLLLIVVAFSVKFGSRRLSEDEGRGLKLVSGLMMLMLGLLLVFAPDMLSQIGITVALLAATLAVAALLIWIDRRKRPPAKPAAAKHAPAKHAPAKTSQARRKAR